MMTILAAGSIFWIIVLYTLSGLSDRNGETGMKSYCSLECGEFRNRAFQEKDYSFENPMMYRAEREGVNRFGGGYNGRVVN